MKYRLKSCLICAFIILSLAAGCAHKKAPGSDGPSAMETPVSQDRQDTVPEGIYRARDAVLVYFVPVSADVIETADRIVTVRPRDDVSLRQGMRFSIFREGAPFYHPVTNELIGTSEDVTGRIEITGEGPADGSYQGMVISGEVRDGDVGRISSSRLKLAFFQERTAEWAVSEALYGALKDTGRFEYVEAYAPDYSAETLAKLARERNADAALLLSTPDRDGKRYVNIKLYWAEDAGLAGEIEEAVRDDPGMSAPDETFISDVFREHRPWLTYSLPGGLLAAMGDVDGDGSRDFAVSDGRNIRIYSVERDFMELWNIKTQTQGTHLSLDILDVNGNGRAEIFVTSAANSGITGLSDETSSGNDMRLDSFVLEYDPTEGFKRIGEDLPYFMRVIGTTLLMQPYSVNRIFGGPVYRAKWNGRGYEPAVPFALPPGANIYGFAFVDWRNEGRVDVMTYDDDGHLNLFDDRMVLKWKSEQSYGPFTFSFKNRTGSVANPVIKWSVRGRLAVVKTDRGQEIVAVSRQPVLSAIPGLGVKNAEVHSLWWDGNAMERKLIMDEIYGTVTDYWVQGKELFIVAKAGLGTFLRRLAQGDFSGSSILFYYNFGQAGKVNEPYKGSEIQKK